MKNYHKVSVNEPHLLGNEKKYLLKCLKDGYISSSGHFVKEFEKKFAKRVNRKFAISVSNGTAALQLAYEALNIKKKDEIILPAFTIISCILPVIRSGATPVLIDSDPTTWNMDVSKIESKITSKTKAIIAPHIYGLPIDMDPLLKIAKKYKLKVIEDSAEALGLKYKNKECGSFGDVSTFSFYANKHITTGEGGMIVTDDIKIAERCRSLRNICFNNKRRFLHYELGWNYRFTNLQSAIGLAQLEKLNRFIVKKRNIGKTYNKELSQIKIFQTPLDKKKYADNIYWVYGLVLKKNSPISLNTLMKKLKKNGIETRNFFWPLHQQPVLKKMGFFKKSKLPVSEYLSRNGFYLPTGLSITSKQQKYVINKLKKIIYKYL
jgi:perosamine synthetase|tara:strand:- start:1821 stop:2954 length:1134 start_codon:yes stop_codon:yes gene_type:complete